MNAQKLFRIPYVNTASMSFIFCRWERYKERCRGGDRVDVEECHRVLRRGGYACIRNGTRESDFPHRHFFPALRALIGSDLPSRRDIEPVFAAGGFTLVVHQVVTQVTAPDWPSFIEKSALCADSYLARLSDDDFQQGMAALRSAGDAINQDDAVTEEIDWFVFTRHG